MTRPKRRTGWQKTSCRLLVFPPPVFLGKTPQKYMTGLRDCPCRPRAPQRVELGLGLGSTAWYGGVRKKRATETPASTNQRPGLDQKRGNYKLNAGGWSDWSRLVFRPPGLFFKTPPNHNPGLRGFPCRPRSPQRVEVRLRTL